MLKQDNGEMAYARFGAHKPSTDLAAEPCVKWAVFNVELLDMIGDSRGQGRNCREGGKRRKQLERR